MGDEQPGTAVEPATGGKRKGGGWNRGLAIRWPDRFWEKVDVRDPDDCWPWRGYIEKSTGRGRISIPGGKRALAYVIAYELAVGPVPFGKELDHRCHVAGDCVAGVECPHRRCCNPAHLEPVSHTENVQRGNVGLNNRSQTHCPQGHPYDDENTYRFVLSGGGIGRACRICTRSRT